MRKFLTGLLLLAATATACGQTLRWTPFEWAGATLGGRRFEKAAILVPVTLGGVPHKFNMQLDLGAVTTVLYGNAIAPYLAAYPALRARLDTTRTFYIQSRKNPKLIGVPLRLGDVPLGPRDLGLFRGFGDSLTAAALRSPAEQHVGTLAPDLFQGRVLIIDYPRHRLAVADQVPAAYAGAAFQPFQVKDGRIRIPLRVGGQLQELLFDTGSSLFALLSTQARAEALAPGPVQDSVQTSSWGEYYYVYGRRPAKPIYFGSKQLPPALVYYDKRHQFDKFYAEEGVWGITGNAYFLGSVVIIDYRQQRFGVL